MAASLQNSNTVRMVVLRIPVPLFDLGQCKVTHEAADLLCELNITPFELLDRHNTGDWGCLCKEDLDANVAAIEHDLRIFSSYVLGSDNEKVWVITEADRSATTVLLPDEY